MAKRRTSATSDRRSSPKMPAKTAWVRICPRRYRPCVAPGGMGVSIPTRTPGGRRLGRRLNVYHHDQTILLNAFDFWDDKTYALPGRVHGAKRGWLRLDDAAGQNDRGQETRQQSLAKEENYSVHFGSCRQQRRRWLFVMLPPVPLEGSASLSRSSHLLGCDHPVKILWLKRMIYRIHRIVIGSSDVVRSF